MSAILKMLEAADKATPAPWINARHNGESVVIATDPRGPAEYVANGQLIDSARNATADIQRLVSWVESADHKMHCETENGRECDCGLDEIQSLLRS